MRTVLITGATGYVGRHVARAFLDTGDRVHVVVRPTSDLTPLADGGLAHGARPEIYDGSIATLLSIVERLRPDTVVHLAADTGRDADSVDVDRILEANVVFGTRLLEACATHARGAAFVAAGSFWEHTGPMHDEANGLYAAAKRAFHEILGWYTRSGRVRGVTLVLFDVYGPDDPRNRVLQQLARAVGTGETLAMSPGEQRLDLVHVRDAARAFLRAARLLEERDAEPARAESFAIAGGRRLTLREVANLVGRVAGRPVPVAWGARAYREGEVMEPWDGPRLPGWAPEVKLEAGVREVLAACDVSPAVGR